MVVSDDVVFVFFRESNSRVNLLITCVEVSKDEQIQQLLKEWKGVKCCALCLEQFYEGKNECRGCGFDLNSFNEP